MADADLGRAPASGDIGGDTMTTRIPFKWTISEQAWGLDAVRAVNEQLAALHESDRVDHNRTRVHPVHAQIKAVLAENA